MPATATIPVAPPAPPLRIANFMDSPLGSLAKKGNLAHVEALYNPLGLADQVVHFTAHPSDLSYAGQLAKRRIEVFPFFDGRQTSTLRRLLSVPGAWLVVLRKMRRDRLNIVRGRLPYFGSLMGCLAAKLLRVPSVVSLGGDNRLPQLREGRFYFSSKLVSFSIEWLVLRVCDAIIVPNRFTQHYVGTILGPKLAEAKTVVIPWAVMPTVDEAAADLAALGLSSDRPLVLVVGHLNQYKYASQMFSVAKAVLESRSDVQFVFCGDGPLRAEAERLLGAIANAHLLGWQPNGVILSLMRRAAMILIPMSGFVLVEAAAAGLPVITSDLEWHGEVVSHGETGWLLSPNDVSAWAAQVNWILDHRAEAQAVGARLRERCRHPFAPESVLQQEVDLYARLIHKTA